MPCINRSEIKILRVEKGVCWGGGGSGNITCSLQGDQCIYIFFGGGGVRQNLGH